MITLGSGDPTRAICSTLVAESLQAVRYPILPSIERRDRGEPLWPGCVDEILHMRHHSLFVPRDFDVSPCFQVVKPTIEAAFDPRGVTWALAADEETPLVTGRATRTRHASAADGAAHGHDQNPSHHIDQFPVVNT